jgi:hypothetical protein
VLVRDRSATGYHLALVTTDPNATAAQVIERYASSRSIEVAIEDAKQVYGTGQARNRAACAVERTVPFMSPARPSPTAGTPPTGTNLESRAHEGNKKSPSLV